MRICFAIDYFSAEYQKSDEFFDSLTPRRFDHLAQIILQITRFAQQFQRV
jgi:hypothetical protein